MQNMILCFWLFVNGKKWSYAPVHQSAFDLGETLKTRTICADMIDNITYKIDHHKSNLNIDWIINI